MLETLASGHPFIVHFAVAFSIGSAAFDVLDFFFHRKRLEDTGLHLAIAAIPFLLLAVFTGNLAETHAGGLAPAAADLEMHKTYANIAIWVFSAAAFWRILLHFRGEFIGIRKIIYVFIITAAAMSVYLAALYGGAIRHAPRGASVTASVAQFPGAPASLAACGGDSHTPASRVITPAARRLPL